MNRTLVLLFGLLVIGIAGLNVPLAAQEQGKSVPITSMGLTISGQRIPFRPGDSGIRDQLRLVVRDREAWVDVWKRIHSRHPYGGPSPDPPPLPEIDFSREMLIVVGMGSRPSSGYAIIIDGAYIYERNYRLEVVVRSVENRKCGGLAVMTAPVDIVRLSKTDRTVIFRETEVVPACH